MKLLTVARKSLREIVREPQLLLLELLLPIVFVGITAASYSTPLQATHPVLMLDETEPRQGAPLVEELAAQRYADGRPIFDIATPTDRAAAERTVTDQEAAALLIITSHSPLHVTMYGDALSMTFYKAGTLLANSLRRYAEHTEGRPELVHIVEQPLTAAGPRTEFDKYAPGMIVFALLLLLPQTAMLVGREIRWKTLQRLSLTRLHAWELLGGISLSQMGVALVQVVLVSGAALAFGFHNQGSLWLAMVVGVVICLSAVGQGLIVACFVENDSQATNVGSSIAMLQVFLSGSFYRLPPITLFTLAGHQIDLFDIFPATHGFHALSQVLTYGDGMAEIGFRLSAAFVLSLLSFGVGVVVFRRVQMRQ